MRMAGKVAIVVGAGQAAGGTIGNGRAIALLLAREGARVLLVDRDLDSARATQTMIAAEGGESDVALADVTDESSVAPIASRCLDAFGRIDILVNNVGTGVGDGGVTGLDRQVWDTIFAVNVTGMFLTCKHVVPVMRRQGAGAIVNISSGAAVVASAVVAYKTSKAAVNALTHHLATANFRYGIRANTIMPGLLDTPMAINAHTAARGVTADELRAERHASVPLKGGMGTAWDTAYATLFLASDEAKFITGVVLPVDGGQTARIG